MLQEGSVIDQYRLIRPIGEGGTASVYLASRVDDPAVQVALKILRTVNDPHTLERFNRERRLLAQLQHPYIASFFNFGITEEGLPWMAMQHITGVPIMQWIHREKPDLGQRLQLMIKICEAVSYAHGQLIIHRDLKPSNILVTPDGNPCLLDFGIASIINRDSGESEDITRLEDQAMTPEYASPEQVQGKSLSASSDVYSLGIVFFEMLTGKRPYYFETRNYLEIIKIICEGPVHKASTLVQREQPELAIAYRHLKGDLDNILLKTLSKLPNERYGSVLALINDLRAWKAGLPIMAQGHALFYRPRKFIKRNAGLLSLAGTFILILLGFSYAMWQQRNLTIQERDRALQKQRSAEEVTDFVVSIFNRDPLIKTEQEVTRKEVIEQATAFLERVEEPSVRSRILHMLGVNHHSLGNYNLAVGYLEEAESIFTEAGDEENLSNVRVRLAECYFEGSENVKALELMDKVLEQLPKSETYKRVGPLILIGKYYWKDNQIDKATAAFEEAAPLLREVPDEMRVSYSFALDNNYGLVLMHSNRIMEAIQRFERALERFKVTNDPNIYETRVIHYNLGMCYASLGNIEEAKKGFQRCLDILTQFKDPDFVERAYPLLKIGEHLILENQFEEAESLIREAYVLRSAKLPQDSIEMIDSMLILSTVLARQGKVKSAQNLYQTAITQASNAFPPQHFFRLGVVSRAARVAISLNHLEEAYQILQEATVLNTKELDTIPTAYQHLLALLGITLIETDEEAATLYFDQAIELKEKDEKNSLFVSQVHTYKAIISANQNDAHGILENLKVGEMKNHFSPIKDLRLALRAHALASQGNVKEAQLLFTKAYKGARKSGHQYTIAYIKRWMDKAAELKAQN